MHHRLRPLAALWTRDLVLSFAQNVRGQTWSTFGLNGVDIVHHVHQRNVPARRTVGAAVVANNRRGLH
jgi:hypothetical protein